MKQPFTLLLALAAAPCAPAQIDLLENLEVEFLRTEQMLDSIYDRRLMFRPFGPMVDEQSMYLSENDYREVAEALGVEIAAIKAVVDIETGQRHEGFWLPGKPLINFDLSIYNRMAPRHGVDLKKARRQAPVIFEKPNLRKYGSRQGAMYARLDAATQIDEDSALESVFWGMFQIGGFNWRKCGVESLHEFVAKMRHSERDQLDLFAEFCKSNDLVKYIRDKNWAAFASRYNGPSYKSRGYDRRLANAYEKFRKQQAATAQ